MKIEISHINESKIAEVVSDKIFIMNTQDAFDIMVDIYYQDIGKIILHEKNITAEFFNLKSGLAGEILQKFSNYRVQLAIVGEFSKYKSKNLNKFIFESNKNRHINFVSTVEDAKIRLAKE